MSESAKIGIIICDRYRRCAGGKCFRSVREREGAFARYKDVEVEVVGYTSCDGCPGGNIEYAVEEMKANGAEIMRPSSRSTRIESSEKRTLRTLSLGLDIEELIPLSDQE